MFTKMTMMSCHHCNKQNIFYITRLTIYDLYYLETKTSFLHELWMINLRLSRSVKTKQIRFCFVANLVISFFVPLMSTTTYCEFGYNRVSLNNDSSLPLSLINSHTLHSLQYTEAASGSNAISTCSGLDGDAKPA